MSKKKLSISGSKEISGFGDSVIKITDQETGKPIAFIGKENTEEKIHLPQSVTLEQFQAISELIAKKKLNKFLEENEFHKAQEFVDRKWK